MGKITTTPWQTETGLRAASRSPTDNDNPHRLANKGKYTIAPLRAKVLTDDKGIPILQTETDNPLLAGK